MIYVYIIYQIRKQVNKKEAFLVEDALTQGDLAVDAWSDRFGKVLPSPIHRVSSGRLEVQGVKFQGSKTSL